ncbi:MAG: GlsB/YeaQ/YmgE family stress response membrane protein [Beijerinckiaceae bacterium]
MNFIIWLIVGGLAGWLAGKILQGAGFGLIGNVVIGICGSVLAGWLLPQVGFPHIGGPFISELIYALIGALVILIVLGAVQRRR